MSLDDFSDFVAYSKQHFEEGLIRAGFIENSNQWRGLITHSTGSTEVDIIIQPRFPFQPPRVLPVDAEAVPWSWHRELDGALCLVANDDHRDLWWAEASAFIEHVTAWFENSDSGWAQDRPDLDLDRYFLPAENKDLYLYGDLAQYRNTFVRFKRAVNSVMKLTGRGLRPPKSAKKHPRDAYGYVADVGDVKSPPRNWGDLLALMDSAVGLEGRVRDHSVGVLVLMYNRGGHEGAIVLEVWPTTTGDIAVRRLRSGADTAAARSARSGPHSVELNSRRVAVIGVGALGSFIADMLVRAGIRQLTLIDGDVVMPGNLVRHLVGPEAVGQPKTVAVKNYLSRVHSLESSQIDAHTENIVASTTAIEVLRRHDLVVNATADFAITALFHKTAEAIEARFLSAALQNEGHTFRIDVIPPLSNAAPLPASGSLTEPSLVPYFEAGCGSPISPTPPHAVIEAAAAAVRHAVGLLVEAPVHPAGEVRHLSPKLAAV
ncbi:ThiF family adenylyltransferase [Kocuria rosea]|uniref:ThiF family adenylyltransferase n=1 Tax=Kocuria rosea TaxID=1275 RepID=UPI002B242BA9|nr:ThiF family adenylyltransferase [Kocuria rosea]MEB2529149.1 ThiF family adenylyltransferase [Kocuria rosea]MEB2619654.1 ThiF family adenylyltransferase [Kocuria rosea]